MWKKGKKYFVSFIEEMIMNPEYKGFRGGRVEITPDGEHYASEEIRFFTSRLSELYRLRDEYDFKEISKKQLDLLRKSLRQHQMRVD